MGFLTSHDRLLLANESLIRREALCYCGRGVPLDDLLQEARLAFHDVATRVWDPDRPRSNLESLARFRIHWQLRNLTTRAPQRDQNLDWPDVLDACSVAPEQENAVIAAEERSAAREFLQGIGECVSDVEANVVRMHVCREFTFRQIAFLLGMSKSRAEQHFRKALVKLSRSTRCPSAEAA